jgi:hypothetical protein
MNLKNDEQWFFMVRNVFCPHKDYSSFLSGKLIVFNLCNYGKGNGVDFGIVSNYFVVYEVYFVVSEFSRTIRAASVYLLFMPYFLFMLSIGMSGVLWYWPEGQV